MLVPYESFLSSDVFRVKGPQGKFFFIHGGLLSRRSEGLAIHVNGEMLEANTKEIILEAIDGDIDDDTVMRFIEYAYTGDYTVPGPDIVLTSSDIGSQNGNQVAKLDTDGQTTCDADVKILESELQVSTDDAWDSWASPSKNRAEMKAARKAAKIAACRKQARKSQDNPWRMEEERNIAFRVTSRSKSRRSELWDAFCSKVTSRPMVQWKPQLKFLSSEDYTNVLLCHVQLYIFSCRWQCHDLRDLVLEKLRLTLSEYMVDTSKISEIVTLVQHTYSHTQDYSNGGIDKLRDLVMDFAIHCIEEMQPDEGFRKLLTKENEIGRDLITKLMQRLD